MDLKQLDTFVHVAELASFTRAAEVLGIAQPALSRQVRQLETELRQTLFQRTGRGVVPTEAGQRLLGHARGILQQVQRLRLDMEHQRGVPTGHLAIGLPPSISRVLTAPLVAAFRQRFPAATVTVVEGLSAYMLEWLQMGRIDLAVVYNVAPSPAFELRPVLDEALYLVSARQPGQEAVGPPLPLEELAEFELVVPSRPHSIRMLLEQALVAVGRRPRVAVEIESVPAILELAHHQGLNAVLTLNAVHGHAEEAALRVRPIRPARGGPRLVTTQFVARSTQRPGGPLVEQGAELLAGELRRRWSMPDIAGQAAATSAS